MKNAILERVNEVTGFAATGAALGLGETRLVDSIEIGQWVRQGDVYLRRIEEAPRHWKETANRQLAPGTTMGSRHTVDDSVTVYANPDGAKVERLARGKARCLGAVVVARDRFTVAHPEHADMSLPAGIYQVQYQVDPASMKRVED